MEAGGVRGHHYFVYMLASGRNGTLYVGMTNSLVRRMQQHRSGEIDGFTKAYDVKRLVWFQQFEFVQNAIHHEKQLKRWRRSWKIELIEDDNPQWLDLFDPIQNTVIPAEAQRSAGTQATGLEETASIELGLLGPG